MRYLEASGTRLPSEHLVLPHGVPVIFLFACRGLGLPSCLTAAISHKRPLPPLSPCALLSFAWQPAQKSRAFALHSPSPLPYFRLSLRSPSKARAKKATSSASSNIQRQAPLRIRDRAFLCAQPLFQSNPSDLSSARSQSQRVCSLTD